MIKLKDNKHVKANTEYDPDFLYFSLGEHKARIDTLFKDLWALERRLKELEDKKNEPTNESQR